MASTWSPLKIQLMATGENLSTWGNVTNANLGTGLSEMIVGSADITFASANETLTLSDSTSSQTARNMRLNCIGTTGGTARNLVVPAVEKIYVVSNGCADTITVKNATGTGIAIPAGKTTWVYNNGTNVLNVVSYLTALDTVDLTATNVTVSSFIATTSYLAGSSSALAVNLPNAAETTTISAIAATGTINYDVSTQSVLYYTTSASANWTLNIRHSSGTALNTAMSTGQTVTVTFMVTQGTTAYYNSVLQIDGSTVTPKWQGGAPTSGNASGVDVYTYAVLKTGAATFTVLASVASFT
jgi:hypothetical protein